MTNDPISDLLIRIKNGYLARQDVVVVPHSNVKEALSRMLSHYGYIGTVKRVQNGRTISLELVYRDGVPALTDVKRISKPGLRRFVRSRDLGRLTRGLGHVILTTPKGLKTHVEAKLEHVGGEILCAVW